MNKRKYKHRFKTEKEFEDEYGSWWRSIVPHSFPNYMDYLLGQTIDFDSGDFDYVYDGNIKNLGSKSYEDMVGDDGNVLVKSFRIKSNETTSQYIHNLIIGRNMIKVLQQIPTYNRKKLVYE